MLPSPRHSAARLEIAWHPIEPCILGGTRHPMLPFHPEVIKQSRGQAGMGAEAAAPCKICSITPLRKGEKGWEGREEADF